MPPRTRFFWIAFGIALSLVLPIVGSLMCVIRGPQTSLENIPVHTLLETAGGLLGLAIAGILMAGAAATIRSLFRGRPAGLL